MVFAVPVMYMVFCCLVNCAHGKYIVYTLTVNLELGVGRHFGQHYHTLLCKISVFTTVSVNKCFGISFLLNGCPTNICVSIV